MIKKIWDKVMNREVISYLIFGVLTTLVNWVVYAAMVKVHIDYRIATAAAWAVSVLFAFIVNKIFVFQSYNLRPAYVMKEITSFVGVQSRVGCDGDGLYDCHGIMDSYGRVYQQDCSFCDCCNC